MRDPETVVREFCAAWSGRDVDAILAWFAADAVCHNMPIAPVRGHAEIRGVLEMFVPRRRRSSSRSSPLRAVATSSSPLGGVGDLRIAFGSARTRSVTRDAGAGRGVTVSAQRPRPMRADECAAPHR
jgi:ketosteroid isomerase-like protein